MPRNRLIPVITCIISLCLGICTAYLTCSKRLAHVDNAVTNIIYQYNSFDQADSRITLVTIDDASEAVYGH